MAKEKKPVNYLNVPPDVWDKVFKEFTQSVEDIAISLPHLQHSLNHLESMYANR